MELVKKSDYFERNADGTQGTMKRKGGFNEALSVVSSKKGNRAIALESNTVTLSGIEYDANEISMDRLNRIVSLANAEYNYRVSVGELPADAYKATYKDQKVTWIGVDNLPHLVQVESLIEVLRASMTEMGAIWMEHR